MENIVRGISPVSLEDQVVVANYRPQVEPGEGIHVVEMANGRAKHFDDKMLVFGRWITEGELQRRQQAYQEDPDQYGTDHLASLSH